MGRVADEAETLMAFVADRARRERLVGVLTTKKRSRELDRALSHEDLWDPDLVRRLSPDEQNAAAVEGILRELGAGPRCSALGGSDDGEELDLQAALEELVGSLQGCVLICVPGRLAYHESEDAGERCILTRPR